MTHDEKVGTASPQLPSAFWECAVSDRTFWHSAQCQLIEKLSYTHIQQFLGIDENIGQLNTYVSWYRKNMMSDGDNQPVGLLLCTGKDHALVEYALAGMDNSMFVSKYQLELPSNDVIRKFLEENA
jgi:hypothetical protein